jgi:hypothetical protein
MAAKVIKGTKNWNAIIDGVHGAQETLVKALTVIVTDKKKWATFQDDMKPYFLTQKDRDLKTPDGKRGHTVKTSLNKLKVKGSPHGFTLSTTATNGCEKDDDGKLISSPVLMRSKGNGNNKVRDFTAEQATKKLDTVLNKFPVAALGRLVDMHPNALHKLIADHYDARMAGEKNRKPATRKASAGKPAAKAKAKTRARKAS